MTGAQWALVVLGGVIGGMLYRLIQRAITWAVDRKRAPGSDLPVRLTRTSRRWLLVLLTDAANIGGGTIWHLAGGSSGRVYFGFLDQLEDAGLVIGEWETPEPQDHPRRRFYRLTPEGRAAAMKALNLKEGVRS